MFKRCVLLSLIGTMFIILPLSAQAPDTLWTRVYGGSGRDEGHSVWVTEDGGFIVTGRTNSYGAGKYDIWLLKLDANGDTMWTSTYGGADRELSYSVEQTPDGGYIIGGGTETYATGGEDFYVIKTDSAGGVMWTQVYGGILDEELESLTRTPDGGYVMTGRTKSFGEAGDYWLVKTDQNGDSIWSKTYGGGGNDFPYEVLPTRDGGYIITGWIGENGNDVYTVKTDAEGGVEWEKAWGESNYDGGEGVVQTSDDGYAVVAGTAPLGEGSEDIWLIKTDPEGNIVWDKTYGGNATEWSYGISLTYEGGFIITGVTTSYGAGDGDTYVIRTDTAGDTLWTATYGAAGYEECYEVRRTSDDGYILVGITDSYGAGENDVYIVRLAAEEKPGIEVHPSTNPTFIVSTSLNQLKYDIPCRASLTLYSASGHKVLEETVEGKGIWVDFETLSHGVYFVRLESKEFKVTEKLIILR